MGKIRRKAYLITILLTLLAGACSGQTQGSTRRTLCIVSRAGAIAFQRAEATFCSPGQEEPAP